MQTEVRRRVRSRIFNEFTTQNIPVALALGMCGLVHAQRGSASGTTPGGARVRRRVVPADRNERELVRAEGVEPSRAFAGPTDFRATSAFAAAIGVRGLDYPFDVPRIARSLAAARLVSTPSRRKPSVRAWLGIAISGFPDFGQFCIAGFPGERSSSPQVRCVCQFRHTRVADHPLRFMIGQPQALRGLNSRCVPARPCVLGRLASASLWASSC